MVYYIDQAFFTLKDKFDITDELNNVVYTVTSPTFAVTSRFQFFDASGKEVAYVKRTASQIASFIWYPDKARAKATQTIGVLEDDPKLTHSAYDVYLPNDVRWRAEGDLFAFSFTIKKDNVLIATIQKTTLLGKDCYSLTVANDCDALSAILTVVCIDNACHSSRPFRIFK